MVIPLVPKLLRNRLLDRVLHVGPLALDHGERNPVDEQHDVGAAGVVAAGPLDDVFLRDVKDVVRKVVPVDVVERKALHVAADRLLQALAPQQQLIDFLVPADQTVEGELLQGLDGRLDVPLRELELLPLVADRVDLPQLLFQDSVKQDGTQSSASQPHRFILGQVPVAEVLQQLERRHLRDVVFSKGWEFVVHAFSPLQTRLRR